MLQKLILNILLPTLKQSIRSGSDSISMDFIENFSVYGIGQAKGNTLQDRVHAQLTRWLNKDINYLEFNILAISNLNVRVYRKGFSIQGNELSINANSAIAFYSRVRKPNLKHSEQRKICDLSAGKKLEHIINEHLMAIAHQKATYQRSNASHNKKAFPTLLEYLPEYRSVCYQKNPGTVQDKVQRIEKHFSKLLDTPINEINKSHLSQWLRAHTVKCTRKELNAGSSHYDLKESTLKGAMSTLRAAIKAASIDPRHPFPFDDELRCNSLKLPIHNIEEKYYSEEELQEIYRRLITRDQEKLKHKSTASRYCDYFTPLTLLCMHTGLRPKYALRIAKRDINFNDNIITIKATIGKIRKNRHIKLTHELKDILTEWLKHDCHRTTTSQWLFPSPINANAHLTSYKKTAQKFKASLSFKHFDFRIMRHTFATLHTKQTKDIRKTQVALGHANIKTTERYSHIIHTDRHHDMSTFSTNLSRTLVTPTQSTSL